MPYLNHAWILDELPQQSLKIFAIESRVLKRNRELDQQRAELARGRHSFQPLACQAFIFVIRANGNRRCRLYCSQRRVRERAVQFCGEEKAGVCIRHNTRPELRYFWLDVTVKRCVDFDDIEAASH